MLAPFPSPTNLHPEADQAHDHVPDNLELFVRQQQRLKALRQTHMLTDVPLDALMRGEGTTASRPNAYGKFERTITVTN